MTVVINGSTGITTPSPVVLEGSTSGTLTLAGPAVAGTNTQTLVAVTGTLAPVVSGTAVNVSGTSVNFTDIPPWVKRITVMLNVVSTTSIGIPCIQIGSGSVDTSGYTSAITQSTSSTGSTVLSATNSIVLNALGNASYTLTGQVVLTLVGSNIWVASVCLGGSGNFATVGGGAKTLSGVLDRVRLTTTTGIDTFDAGTINIIYE